MERDVERESEKRYVNKVVPPEEGENGGGLNTEVVQELVLGITQSPNFELSEQNMRKK